MRSCMAESRDQEKQMPESRDQEIAKSRDQEIAESRDQEIAESRDQVKLARGTLLHYVYS